MHTLTVKNDDPGVVASTSSLTIDEGGTDTYTVRLGTQPSGAVTVTPTSSNPSAATVSPSRLTFTRTNWSTPQTVTVSGVADDFVGPDRRASLRHRVSGYGSITTGPAVSVTVRNDDVPGVTVFAKTHSLRDPVALATGENETGIYRVALDAGPAGDVTIRVASADPGIATAEAVRGPAGHTTLTFTRANWREVQEVLVRGVNDDATNPRVPAFEDRRGRTTRIVHTIAGGGYDSVTVADAPVFVQDDDHLQLLVSTRALTLDEGSGDSAAYTLRLNRPPQGDVTVRLTVTDPDEAVDVTPTTLTFTPDDWRRAQTVTVRPRDDDAPGARTARIAHAVTGGGYEGRGFRYEVTVAVTDDDGVTPTPPDPDGRPQSVSVSPSGLLTWTHDATGPEEVEWYFVEWIAGTRPPASMEWRWEDEHITTSDYASVDGHMCRAAGRCRVQIEDFDPEWHYLVHVNTSERIEGDLPATAVRHTPPSPTPPPGAPSVTLSGGPAVTEGTAATFTVTAEPAPASDLAVLVSVSDAEGADFVRRRHEGPRTVTVPAGRTGTTFEVPTRNDRRAEPGGDITATLEAGADYALGGAASATVAVSDDDGGSAPAPVEPSVTVADARVTEADGVTLYFTVTLDQAAQETVTVDYATADGTATAGEDYTAASGTLTFAPGETVKTVSVAVLDDLYNEGEETLTLRLSNPVGLRIADGEATGTIVNTDPLPLPGTGNHDEAEAPRFVVYHDPSSSPVAVRRHDTALGLLDAAGVSYTVRTVTGTGTVDRLAGVSSSVLPRFFLGDPEAEGWGPAQAKVNNGGLRWLRSALAALPRPQASPAPAVPAVSVADASAQETAGSIAFTVTLSAAARESVSVDWATADGTAVAGTDYTAASGTLTFAPGETGKTVTVTLLDDVHDEDTETFTLTLSNARPAGKATLADGAATGTISNADPLQKDWLARFGRAAAADAVAAVTARLDTPRDAGSHLTVGGHRLSFDGSGAEPALPPAWAGGPAGASWPSWSDDPAGGESRTMSGRELLLGTSFRAVLGSGAGVQWTGWGQGASVSQFSSTGPGLSLSGETATGSMGTDYEHGRLLAGFAVTHSLGEGTAEGAGRTYAMGSAVTTMLPYARFALSERVSAWGLAGTGTGRLTLDLDGGASERYGTDLSMTLAAAGVRGDLLTPGEAGGFALAVKADALWVRTESEGVSAPGLGNLSGAWADASRLRAVLDGSRTFALAGGRTLAPSATLGLRHDGGDAETGTGVELGASVGYADPSRGLDMALRVQGLAAHADKGYGEWGVSGLLRLVPGGAGRGLSMSLTPSWGADPGGSERLWTMPDAHALAANDGAPLSSRLDGELGYGIAMFGGGFTGTPHVGFGLSDTARELRMGWRLSSATKGAAGGFELSLDAVRREAGNDDGPPEHRIGFGLTARW